MKLKSILIAGLLAASSLGAQAENLTANPLLTGIPNLSGGFSLTHLWSGLFTDTITFTPNVSGMVDGAIMTIGFGTANIDFMGADINGNALTLYAVPPGGPFAGYYETGVLLPTSISGPLVLTVHGYAGPDPINTDIKMPVSATYTGSINVRPVPEPETYGMLLGGLGILAFLSRRRKT
jgi:hypothetical protein